MKIGKRPKWLIIAANVVDNYQRKIRTRLGYLDTMHGASHLAFKTNESIDYIQMVFSEYLSYADLKPWELEGKRVLEIGPGDNFGVALRFLACGASQVVCLDRFIAKRDKAQERQIYCTLREALAEDERHWFDTAVRLEEGLHFNTEKLTAIYGIEIERADQILAPESFDFIISRAVLMEIANPDRAFEVMDKLLRPGGFSLHKVAPLKDYQMFRQYGYHPLEFLTIPDFLYRHMVSGSGKPNRRLRSYYQRRLERPRYEATLHTVTLLGATGTGAAGSNDVQNSMDQYNRALQLLQEIRPRLLKRYQNLPDEELLIEDIFIVAKKMLPTSHSISKVR